MKKQLIILLLLIGSMAYSQNDTIPICVKDAFKTKFPGAKNIYWYHEHGHCRIEFDLLSDSYIVLYTETGEWIETGKIISDLEIPAIINSAVKKKYPKCQISFAEMVVNKKGESFFRINSFNCDSDLVINVNDEGKIISIEEIAVPKPSTEMAQENEISPQ